MVSLIDARIGIEPGIDHQSVDEVIDHGGDVVDAAEAIVE